MYSLFHQNTFPAEEKFVLFYYNKKKIVKNQLEKSRHGTSNTEPLK